ncbi:MAG TPA: stage II sporulation protein M [Gammaproteobacteria bacterium]|nr:stage II sporulation protein M [Gammaproteobacteria bacterium]
MKQAHFEKLHQSAWQAFAKKIQALDKGQVQPDAVQDFNQDYRRICQHLALAKQRGYSYPLLENLEQLALQGHQQFYRHKSPILEQLLAFIIIEFPATVRQQWRSLAVSAALFFGSFALMAILVGLFPSLIYSLLSPAQVTNMENMYDPAQRLIGPMSLRNHQDDWVMFGFYIMNNIGIAFQTFASGLLFGLGSIFFLLFNGLNIGAIAGHLTRTGYSETFWPFVVGHGAFELTAIVIAGAAGLKLGSALIAPGPMSRAVALRVAAAVSIKLIGGVIIFLLLAAFIEAYWSSSTSIAVHIKYAVGAGLWLLVVLYLFASGRNRHAAE